MTWNGVFAAFIAILAVILIRQGGPKKAFYLMTALLPATGLSVDIGISLSASKVIGLILCFPLLAAWFQHGVTGKVQTLGLVFLLYAAIVTTIGRFLAPETTLDSPEFRVQMRSVVQMCSLFLQMLPLFLAPLILRSKGDISAAAKAFFWGTGFLAFGGVVQWVIHWLWGINIFPIYREGVFGEILGVGLFGYGEDFIFRANSLASEPKAMGAALAIAATIWLLLRSGRVIKSFVLSCFYIGLLLLATVLSFSTTAALILCIGLLVLIGTSVARKVRQEAKSIKVEHENAKGEFLAFHTRLIKPATVAIFIATCIGAFSILHETILGTMPLFGDLLSLRVLDRIGDIEDYDEVALEFLSNEPHWALSGVGSGNLPWYAFSYLPSDPVYDYMANLTWNAKSGLLSVVTSYGMIGLCILGSMVAITLNSLLREMRRHYSLELQTLLSTVGSIVFIVAVHALRSVDEFFWLVLGLALAQARSHAILTLQLRSVRLQTSARSAVFQ
jgi:hypothetical protein